jgi:hypothetical protein
VKLSQGDIKTTTCALLDSGCEGNCIDKDYAKSLGLKTKKFAIPIVALNADGGTNSNSPITHFTEVLMNVGTHQETIRLALTSLGDARVFLGHDWLSEHNPSVDWRKQELKFDCCSHEEKTLTMTKI